MTFDATCRELFLNICKKHGLEMEMEPIYGGASYLEKADYIVQKLRTENERLTQENEQLQIKNDELVMKISDVEELIDDITNSTYDKACEVVTAVVKDETQKADHGDPCRFPSRRRRSWSSFLLGFRRVLMKTDPGGSVGVARWSCVYSVTMTSRSL